MKIGHTFIKFSIVVGLVLVFNTGSFAQTTINVPDNGGGATVPMTINVSDPTGIAGAAFTVEYDTSSLTVVDVQSDFFETFAAQQTLSGQTWPATSVAVGGNTYDQPVIWGENTIKSPFGIRVAGARYTGAPAAHTSTLFTVTFQLNTGASSGSYPIQVRPTLLCNPDAGYGNEPDGVSPPNFNGNEEYDAILDVLIGGDTNFTPILTAVSESDVLADGLANFSSTYLNGDFDGDGTVEVFDAIDTYLVATNQKDISLMKGNCDIDGTPGISVFDAIDVYLCSTKQKPCN